MIQSRCGIDCSACDSKAAFGVDCAGCVAIEQPFWGVCPVKSCCENKGLENCGFCGEFPCEQLHAFSYATDGHGDDGARIKRCQEWCRS